MQRYAVMAALALGVAGCGDRWKIEDASFFPVAIEYWAQDKSFLVGSYEHGGIVRVGADGLTDANPFMAPSFGKDGRKKALRISIDSSRDRLWVLDTDRVYVYSLRTRELLTRFDLPRSSRASAGSCLPDMALNPATGAVYVADGLEPKLHEIHEESSTEALVRTELKLSSDGERLGVISALAVVGEVPALIAGSAKSGAVYRIDPFTGRTRQIAVSSAQMLKGICALRAVTESIVTHRREPAPRQFYFTSISSNSLYGLTVSPELERGQVAALTRTQALDSPIAIAPISGYVVATSSQLGRHHDLGGSDDPRAPFRLIAIPGAFGPLASQEAIARRPLR